MLKDFYYTNITSDKKEFFLSASGFFPLQKIDTVSGEYFGYVVSAPYGICSGYILNGIKYSLSEFTIVPFPEAHKNHITTGGGLICLIKNK